MASEIDTFLQKFNGEIDRVHGDDEKCYLKIRSFPTAVFINKYDWDEGKQYRDEFYDTVGMVNLRQIPRKFYRVRENSILQVSEDIQNNSHFYSEVPLSQEEFNDLELSCYLSYEFSRQKGKIPKDKNYEVFLDTLVSPVPYQLITWKIPIPSDDIDTVREIVRNLDIPDHPLPIYTKFMYCLQCSELYPLYDELFDTSLHYIGTEMKTKLSSKAAQETPDAQLYLWSFGQIVHFQVLLDHKRNPQEVSQSIAVMKSQVESNIKKEIYGLHVVEDETDEYAF